MGEHVEYVMIPKEEYDKILNLNCRIYETAKEMLQILIGYTFENNGRTWTVGKEDLQWLAYKYGIKLDE